MPLCLRGYDSKHSFKLAEIRPCIVRNKLNWHCPGNSQLLEKRQAHGRIENPLPCPKRECIPVVVFFHDRKNLLFGQPVQLAEINRLINDF